MPPSPLVKCPRCGTLYKKGRLAVCMECAIFEEEDYSRVRDVLAEIDVATPVKAAEMAGVDVDVVLRMSDVGMISFERTNEKVVCGRCGRPAISKTKRLCEKCMMQLDVALGAERRRVAAEVDSARYKSAREVFEEKRRTSS